METWGPSVVRMDDRAEPAPSSWTFVTTHTLVLLCIAENSEARMTDIAQKVGITERRVQTIVADLVDAGYLTRTRRGRRNHYEIDPSRPLRHLATEHQRLGDLLGMLGHAPAS